MYQQAIVCTPANSLIHGLTSSTNLGLPDYQKALNQHQIYIDTLIRCGVEVTVLPPQSAYPDSCFVEDPVLLTEKVAILTRPGAPTRQGEVTLIEPTIRSFYQEQIKQILAPGTVEAGDVLRIDNHFFIGLSKRTNADGAKQLGDILSQYGYSSSVIQLKKFLHLKTGVSYLGEGFLLVNGELIGHPEFQKYQQIIIDDKEAYAANCIRVNNAVIMAQGFDYSIKKVEHLGFNVIPIDMSEFRKIDGGLSCLSLRF